MDTKQHRYITVAYTLYADNEAGNHRLEEEAKDGEVIEPAEPCRGRSQEACGT